MSDSNQDTAIDSTNENNDTQRNENKQTKETSESNQSDEDLHSLSQLKDEVETVRTELSQSPPTPSHTKLAPPDIRRSIPPSRPITRYNSPSTPVPLTRTATPAGWISRTSRHSTRRADVRP